MILPLDHANAPKDSVATSSLPKYGNIELEPRPLDAGAPFCQAVEIVSDIVVLSRDQNTSFIIVLARDELKTSTAMFYHHCV